MIKILNNNELSVYVKQQLTTFYPDMQVSQMSLIDLYINEAMRRAEFCFRNIDNKYYKKSNGKALIDHTNGDQYAAFLYYLSNSIWSLSGDEILPKRIFLLNKLLHGVDIYYEVALPDIFQLVHPLGTVLGRAQYCDYLVVYQGCTIGSVVGGGYPRIGNGCIMYSNSSILGDCKIGENVIIGANSYVINKTVDDNKVITGQHPNTVVKQSKYTSSSYFVIK